MAVVIDVVVADGEHRQIEVYQPADMPSVRTGGIDHRRAGDQALVGLDRRDAAALPADARDPDPGLEPHARARRLVPVARDQVCGLQIAVARAPQDRSRRTEIEGRP